MLLKTLTQWGFFIDSIYSMIYIIIYWGISASGNTSALHAEFSGSIPLFSPNINKVII